MRFESAIDVAAPAATTWAIYRDVERWSEWTASITSVSLLDGPLRVGARARIRQPRLPTAEWQVTELDDGTNGAHRFVWVSRAPGVRTTGSHVVTTTGADTCRIAAGLTQEGPLGAVIGLLTSRLTKRYLAMETAGLRRRAESAQ